MFENIKYYFLTTYRRKALDKALNEYQYFFKGNVLDVGGGKKDGKFNLPERCKVTILDIDPRSKADVVGSVESLPFNNGTFDSVKATELFEHVFNVEKAFSECLRVLKRGGFLVISSPFLYPYHPDPQDYLRISKDAWKMLAKKEMGKIFILKEQGHFFTILAEMLKGSIVNIKIRTIRYLFYLALPILDIISRIDNLGYIKKRSIFVSYIEAYFIVIQKNA